jgi:phosphatidylglycerol:prolipoprotein diacylglycerol transferase
MLPFIDIAGLHFGSYGICLVTGFFIGYFIFKAELKRRALTTVRPAGVVVLLCLVALLTSKLYWVLQNITTMSAARAFSSPAGFTYYGGLMGDFVAVLALAKYFRVPALSLCDALAAPCALGYGIGRIGCLLAGDGDYGLPTALPWGMTFPSGLIPTQIPVHPTPLYEFAGSALITCLLWRRGSPTRGHTAPPGEVFALFLALTGAARFAVEFVKRNPKILFGLTNAQLVAFTTLLLGVLLLAVLRWARSSAHSTMQTAS